MARKKPSIVFLDTHIVVWLYAGLTEKISDTARQAIEENDLMVSPLVKLELQYLFEIGRITVKPDTIIKNLFAAIGLTVSETPLQQVIEEALPDGQLEVGFNLFICRDESSSGYHRLS